MSERVAKLIEKCKSNDIDARIAAVQQLQAEFEAEAELTDFDGAIQGLKNCLRTQNQLLTLATLAALPPFFHLLTIHSPNGSATPHDAAVLRQALAALLPAGGLVDRLGDNREKARENARQALVVLGGIVFSHSGLNASTAQSLKGKESVKGPEPPMAILERFIRELGLASKVWRVREQTITTLVHLRRAHPSFPIRPYLPQLVEGLEDSDGTVRDCARNSVIEIFTAPGVTDAARADLKKEMTKKNVRKTIVDAVLGKLMVAGPADVGSPPPTTATNDSDFTKPPTLSRTTTLSAASSSSAATARAVASAPSATTEPPASQAGAALSDVPTVFVASARDLEQEFANMLPHFEGKETERNWQHRDKAISRIRGMLKGDVHIRFPEGFLNGLRSGTLEASLKTLASLRTTVAINTCALYTELIVALGGAFDHFVELTLVDLLKMAAYTKKIIASQTQATVKDIFVHTSPQPRIIIPLLWRGVQDKNVQARQYTIGHVKTYLEVHGARAKLAIESTGGQDLIDKSIRKALGDPNAGVREGGRLTFWAYNAIWQEKAELIYGTLDATGRKQIDKAAPQELATTTVASTSAAPKEMPKKSSLAAAIAASRAKAKQIAAAPPTLRHAATAHAAVITRRSSSPAVPASPKSPRAASPSTPSRKRASITLTRPVSTPGRAAVGTPSPSPPGSPPGSSTFHKRTSPLATTNETPRRPTSVSVSVPPSHGQLRSSLSARSASPPVVTPSSLSSNPRRTSLQYLPSSYGRLTPSSSKKDKVKDSFSLPVSPDEDLLMYMHGPGSETSSNESIPINFSTPFQISQSKQAHDGVVLTPSTTPLRVPGPVVEDALRARAEQAESAAERLLEELAEPDDQPPPFPPSLLPSTSASPPTTPNGKSYTKATGYPRNGNATNVGPTIVGTPVQSPATPAYDRRAAALRQAALFQDSPPYKGASTTPSIVDMLKENRHESGWWLKRISLMQQGRSLVPHEGSTDELKEFIVALEDGKADVNVLKKLALLCSEHPVAEDELPSPPLTPSQKYATLGGYSLVGTSSRAPKTDIWHGGKLFDKLLMALMQFLQLDKEEDVLEYGLIVLWEMLENQPAYLEGRESEVLALLFRLRFANKQNVAEATNTIRDAIATRIDPVYGLKTMTTSLKHFLTQPIPSEGSPEARSLAYAFGLLAIGKFLLRLPADIVEEELPRMKTTLTEALNNSNLLVRESAAASIIAAQLVLRDETYLFTLLDSLTAEKKNLLTYLFDKHGARGNVEGVSTTGATAVGLERLEKEMRRLDTRTSAAPRKSLP